MIEVQPEILEQFAGFAEIVGDVKKSKKNRERAALSSGNESQPALGCRSWAKFVEMTYDGHEKVVFRATDLRHTIESKANIIGGQDAPWRAVMEAWRFQHLKYLEGGSLELGLASARRLLVQRGATLRLRFPLDTMDAAFPARSSGGEATAVASANVNTSQFRSALKFVTAGQTRDLDQGSRPLMLFADGMAMANCGGVWMFHVAPILGFDLCLDNHSMKKVIHWLRLVEERGTEIVVYREGEEGAICYRFQTTDSQHRLIAPAPARPFDREWVERFFNHPSTWLLRLERKSLLRYCRAFSGANAYGRLVFQPRVHPDRSVALHVQECVAANPGDVLLNAAEPHQVVAPEPIRIATSAVVLALQRHRTEQVTVGYCSATRTIAIQAASSDLDENQSAGAFIQAARQNEVLPPTEQQPDYAIRNEGINLGEAPTRVLVSDHQRV